MHNTAFSLFNVTSPKFFANWLSPLGPPPNKSTNASSNLALVGIIMLSRDFTNSRNWVKSALGRSTILIELPWITPSATLGNFRAFNKAVSYTHLLSPIFSIHRAY